MPTTDPTRTTARQRWATALLACWLCLALAQADEGNPASLREAGHYREALAAVDARLAANETPTSELLRERALALRGLGRGDEALAANTDALADAATIGPLWEARLLNDRGLILAELGARDDAATALDAAARLAGADSALSLTVALNRGRLALETGDDAVLMTSVQTADALLSGSLPFELATRGHLAQGRLYQRGNRERGQPATWRNLAWAQYQAAARLAQDSKDARLQSWALGHSAQLYADEQRHDEALTLARRAAFAARSVGADDALFRWQWQIARSLAATGELSGASLAYREAIETLGRLQSDLADGSGQSFRALAAPVFFEFADLKLRATAQLPEGEEKSRQLREVREVIERVKVAEVQEYFEDPCMRANEAAATELDQLAAEAAVIYPILLPDRTELLVSLPSGLHQYTVPVGEQQLTAEVRSFRQQIERYDQRREFLVHAQRLHQWLIEPLELDLAAEQVHTLVVVPDGPLRTIPLAALHDGRSFLVERFALATTPGLTLTQPTPLQRGAVDLLAGGITQSVQGFSALPNVATELDSISQAFPGDSLRDEAFVVDEVQRRIAQGDQDIVHIATHGQFDSDHRQSFLLAYDDKLTMDRLQSTIATRGRQDEPLELLVLSACQTAAGDDRAALGLAGVALNAGARSALASLWFVNDASTARMIDRFYAALGDPANSKADALREAQLALIEDPQFAHPSYWAPFLLIGNWL